LSAAPEKKTCGERSRTMRRLKFQNQKPRPIKYANGLATASKLEGAHPEFIHIEEQ